MKSRNADRVYSTCYTEFTTLQNQKESGKDGWRNGLVTGNGENGVIESCGPAEDTMIFQNIKFNYPTNAIRVTPDLAAVREQVRQSILRYNGKYLSAEGAERANEIMLAEASDWVKKYNLGNSWELQYSYAFHPAHQLRLVMDQAKNGEESDYARYTDYRTGEIGTLWTDRTGIRYERKTFSSREENVTITSIQSLNGGRLNLTISIDDIARMSNEGGVGTRLADLRYGKLAEGEGEYIGIVGHYPFYPNSDLNYSGFAGITRVIAEGRDATKEYLFGSEAADDFVNPIGEVRERRINIGRDKAPAIRVLNAEAVYLITKADRDLEMGTLEEFEKMEDLSSYPLVKSLVKDTLAVSEKYRNCGENTGFSYEEALEGSAKRHREIFDRVKLDICRTEADKNMRGYTNEELIKAQAKVPDRLLPAMLERLFYNGRFAGICASGIQAPRLGGMWTGAWGCEWSGDYTTDANINLQIAGANIGSMPEETLGYINVMLRCITDWQLNAKQIYGIEDALLAPPRTDGDTAVLTHFSKGFPGQIWNSGASWLIFPIYEYYQCYKQRRIELTADTRKELENTGNKYQGYADGFSYNMRSTLNISDSRAEQILQQGYFDLEKDILYPLVTKTANFWLGMVTLQYYTKDGKAYYDKEKHFLEEGESYFIAPAYSPENKPANTKAVFTANAAMDIAAARSVIKMAIELEERNGGADKERRIEQYRDFMLHLPPYVYEESGELKEWALAAYEENYGHRHGSQLYGLWPSFEGETDKRLFAGAKKLIETKNAIDTGDSKSGHGWLHRGLVMARLKDGAGVKDTLLPLVTNAMIYDSMMMAHNIDRTAAYCTDPVLTIPAVILECCVYSDSETIELLPAVLPDLQGGGCIGGSEGIRTRTGAVIRQLCWGEEKIAVRLCAAQNVRLRCRTDYSRVCVNGRDASQEIFLDENHQKNYLIETEEEIVVEFYK